MMVDNLQLEPLSVQFCGELMPQAHIDMCSIIDISNPSLTVNPPRLPVSVRKNGRLNFGLVFGLVGWPGCPLPICCVGILQNPDASHSRQPVTQGVVQMKLGEAGR